MPPKRRRWIKLWIAESLRGSIRFELTPAERGVWYDLLAMAGESRTPGTIQATEGVGYPKPWIAQALNIPVELLEQTLDKLASTDRIKMNTDSISIINFEYYQSNDRTGDKGTPDADKYVRGKYGGSVKR